MRSALLLALAAGILAAAPLATAPRDAPTHRTQVQIPAPEASPRTHTTGPVTATNIAGHSGSYVVRHAPGQNYLRRGIEFSETNDDPCDIRTMWWRLGHGEPPETELVWRNCVQLNLNVSRQTLEHAARWSAPYHIAHGIEVCDNDRNGNNLKLKGARLRVSTVDRDGSGAVQRDPALMREFERPTCRTWTPARNCPSGQVAVGVELHVQDRPGGSVYGRNDVLRGIALRCAAVTASGG